MASSPWISVKDRLPADGQTVAFVAARDDWYDGRVLGGRFRRDNHDLGAGGFSVPGIGFAASHWMPLPDPPVIEQEATDEQP